MTIGELRNLFRGMAPAIKVFVESKIEAALAPLEKRIAVLEKRPEVKYEGIYRAGHPYGLGSLVTDHGALWLAETATEQRPGGAASGWKLIVKAGKA